MQRPALSPCLRFSAIAAIAVITTSCGLFAPKPPAKAKPVLYEWNDDHGPGNVSVRIDLTKQTAIYQRGGRPIGWSFVCSGKDGHETRAGDFTILEKLDVKYSDRYGWVSDATGKVSNPDATPKSPVPAGEFYHSSPMYWWMRLTKYGVGMHAGDIPHPGRPSSHGCIRLPRDFAPIFYQAATVGTPVKVTGGKPKSPAARCDA